MFSSSSASQVDATGGSKTYVDDCFSTYLYTGNSSTQTINNGIDLAGKGGLVWTKNRTAGNAGFNGSHAFIDTVRGSTKHLYSNSTSAEYTFSASTALTGFNSSGYALGPDTGVSNSVNDGNATYTSWTFRKAPKFFAVQTATKSAGVSTNISFSDLGTLGMVVVKRTDSTGDWFVWHKSLSAGKLLYLNQTAAEATLGHVTVSGTTVTLVNGVIADGSYVVYAWAHDTASDGLIQCGSFTTDGSGNATVNLGWEPQWVMIKTTGILSSWDIFDSMRGLNVASTTRLSANTSTQENNQTTNYVKPTSTGFEIVNGFGGANNTYIYLAIRRPNKPPKTGAEVYNAIARTGTGVDPTNVSVGFPVDTILSAYRSVPSFMMFDRLRGLGHLRTNETTGENTLYGSTSALSTLGAWGISNGVRLGADVSFGQLNGDNFQQITHFFRRAPGFFDVVCYTGTGSNKTETHNLGVAPELWLVKGRSGATQWVWGSNLLANTEKIVMPSPNGKVTDTTAWNSTYPTASNLSLGTAAAVNTGAATYVAYLWATKAGISKVGAYTGNGTSQTINCGFTTGARFVMIIRTTASTAQDIYVWDTARGIVSGNDPHLSLNTGTAEVTTDDSIDPDTSGFIVNQVAATNVNVNGASYIYLAIA